MYLAVNLQYFCWKKKQQQPSEDEGCKGKILEVTKQITDPKTYKNTFSNTVYMERRPEVDVQEYYCDDNERTKDEGH